MYRKIGQEKETEEDSVTNLGGQEKEWVLGNEVRTRTASASMKPGRSVFFSIMERQVLSEMPGRSGRE